MNRRSHSHLYERFEPMERLRLAIEARARGDEREYEYLRSTCPTEHFQAEVGAFVEPWRASADLAGFMASMLNAAVCRLEELERLEQVVSDLLLHLSDEAVTQFVEGVRHGDPLCDLQERLSDQVLDKAGARTLALRRKLLEAVSDRKEHVVAEAAAIYEAFCRITGEQLGLEGETLLRAHVGEEVDRLQVPRFESGRLDGAAVDRWEAELRALWDKMLA